MKGPNSLSTLMNLRQMHNDEDIDYAKDLFTEKEYEKGLKEMDELLKNIEETRKNIKSMKYDLNIESREETLGIPKKRDEVKKYVESLSNDIVQKEHKLPNSYLLNLQKENEYKEILKKIEQQDNLVKGKINDYDPELTHILNSDYCKPIEVDNKKVEENIENLVSSIDECLKFGEEIDEYINKMLNEKEKI
jgi:hypothetical protein